MTSAEQRLPIMDHGSWIKDHGSRTMDQRLKSKHQGSDQGSWIVEQGSRIKDHGSRTLDLGPCSGMNDHPGRDTDVISRPSESTIKDLSFYICFIRIGSSIKHLGPCFGTNGHFRRDPDTYQDCPILQVISYQFLYCLLYTSPSPRD